MVLYTGGYILILVEDRYLWFVLILSFILGFIVKHCILKIYFNQFFRIAAILIMVSTTFSQYIILTVILWYKNFYDISSDLKSWIKGNLVK